MPNHWSDSEPVVRLLAGRWTLAVLDELAHGGRRYQDLHAALGSISHKVLTDTLRRAERDGLVIRGVDHSRIDTATLYQLTDLARSLETPVESLGPYPVQFGTGDWITVVSRCTGTFTGEMAQPDGNMVPPTGKTFDVEFVQTSKWEGDLLVEIAAFWDANLQAQQIGLA
jgi:DNA-binding HxlR family transcriptional regulator